jgi:hypothetical protein
MSRRIIEFIDWVARVHFVGTMVWGGGGWAVTFFATSANGWDVSLVWISSVFAGACCALIFIAFKLRRFESLGKQSKGEGTSQPAADISDHPQEPQPDIDAGAAYNEVIKNGDWQIERLKPKTEARFLARDWHEKILDEEIHKALVNGRLSAWGEEILPNGAVAPERPIPADTWIKIELIFGRVAVPRTRANWRVNLPYTGKMAWVGVKFSKVQFFQLFPLNNEKRISLQDFLHVEAIKVGWGPRPGNQHDLADLLDRIIQAGVDGELHLWGRKPPITWRMETMSRSPLVRIDKSYWDEHEIEYTTAIFTENSKIHSQKRLMLSGAGEGQESYQDLYLDRQEATEWLRTSGRP